LWREAAESDVVQNVGYQRDKRTRNARTVLRVLTDAVEKGDFGGVG